MSPIGHRIERLRRDTPNVGFFSRSVVLIVIGAWVVFGLLALAAIWAALRTDSGDRIWPTTLALALALLSWPVVAISLDVTVDSSLVRAEPPIAARYTAALSAVLFSALIGGTLGGPLARRHAVTGAAFTFLVALLVAIPTLPLLPAMLGQDVGAGWVCLDGCGSATGTGNLASGFLADLMFPLAPAFEPVPVLVLAVGIVVWTVLLRRSSEEFA